MGQRSRVTADSCKPRAAATVTNTAGPALNAKTMTVANGVLAVAAHQIDGVPVAT